MLLRSLVLIFVSTLALADIAVKPGHRPGHDPVRNDGGVDFSDLPPSEYPHDAYERFDKRAKKILASFAAAKQNPFGFDHGVDFWLTALGKLATNQDVLSVNQALLDPNAKVYSNVGTDFKDLGFLCLRTGDYDFMLRGLVEIMYHFGDKPDRIWPETRVKLLSLLNQRGNQVHLKNFLWVCGTHPETENHILQTETSRYLTNQLLFKEAVKAGRYQWEYDNEANGMNTWMLKHLQGFFQNDFSEYNSHPYQAYTVMAIQNLVEFTEEPRVKLAATMLMNYLDAKFAVSSNNLRRLVPFRRQKVYNTTTEMMPMDSESQRFIQMAGNTALFDEFKIPHWLDFGTDRMEGAALGKYRTPELILDLVLSKSHTSYFQRFRHTGTELYASSTSFLLTGGGIWIDMHNDFWTWQNAGWAVPTTLMPTVSGLDAANFIQIKGHNDLKKRINTCLAPGFACGLNPVIPDFIPEACIDRTNPGWQFVDFTSQECPLHYGFYAAVYTASCDTGRCKKGGGTFGFFEAAEPLNGLEFATFRDSILANNDGLKLHAQRENTYVTSDGRKIVFVPLPRNKWTWGIHSIDGVRQATNLHAWPLAQGDIMNADGSGLVTIDNPFLRKRLTLDMSNALAPRREFSDY